MVQVRKPEAALQRFIRCYAHVDACVAAESVVQPVPARTVQTLEFTFGDPYKVWVGDAARSETAHPVALIGAQTFRRVLLEIHGRVDAFVIVFQPGAVFQLFSVPGAELNNQHFDAAAVLGNAIAALRLRLGDTALFAERATIADQFLLSRLGAQCFPSSATAAAAELRRYDGCLRIADLAARAGLSVRQFERQFTSQIGVAPKLFARVARFEGALRCKTRSPQLRWTDIAHELGYHDQSHMVRDFWQLSGATPSNAAPEVDMLQMFLEPL
jgi:AraC-like DNA-binding protein